MSGPAWWKRIGLTRGKAALVAALGTVLLVVVFSQLGGDVPLREPRRPSRAGDLAETPAGATVDESVWSAPDAAEIRFDPFLPADPRSASAPPRDAMTAGTRDEAGQLESPVAGTLQTDGLQADVERNLDALQQVGVSVVFQRQDGRRAAVIGGRIVTVGDALDGFRIVSIDERGVAVRRLGPKQH